MPPRRQRAICKGQISFNDVPITGQSFVILGKCASSGLVKDEKGKALPKRDITHVKLRFEDKTWVAHNNLKAFYEFHIHEDNFNKFYDKIA